MTRPAAPLIIAHRGARAFAPENTLEAIDKAAHLGADMVELDVQLSRDGVPVIVHDESPGRTTDAATRLPGRANDRIGSFTLAELQGLDAGGWFVRALELPPQQHPPFLASLGHDESARHISRDERAHYASGAVRVPTLREALVRARAHGLRLNIELKLLERPEPAQREPLVERTLGTIEELGMGADVLVSSFDQPALVRVKERCPSIATGLLAAQPLADPVRACRDLCADAYHPGCAGDSDAIGFRSAEYQHTGRLPAEPVRSLHAAGIAVYVWTENDRARMRQLIELGVDGIFTDYPNRMVEVLGRVPGR